MEYDNDKPRKQPPKMEKFYWIMLLLLSPLTNSLTVFPQKPAIWLVLLLVNGTLLPAYIIYSRIMGAALDRRSRKLFPFLLSLLSFLVILTFVNAVYSLINNFHLFPEAYLTFHGTTIVRECWWNAVNMALSIAIFYVRKADDEKDQLAGMQKENTFYQLRYLRSQLNPHFLFNTLNSIYSLALQKSDKAPEVVVRLADIMRYLIYECNEEKIPLDKEIEFIRNYIDIEKMRHNADIRFTVEGETSGQMIEPFLFISFIENGFKHAMDHSFNEPFIYITLKVGNGQLTLNVINSTNADLAMQAKRVNGIGITHSRSLLELLYPSSYDLDIIQTEKDQSRSSELRMRNARERLENLYHDSHTLDVILNKSSFTVSLILKTAKA
jgi:two-component system, LytTR family, sensor kinase